MNKNFYGELISLPDITDALSKILNSKETNEEEIIKIVNKTNSEQRQEIRALYKKKYKHPIQKDISKSLSYKFREVLLALFDTQYEFDARELNRAFHSLIKNYKVICEIFASRSKEALNFVDTAYYYFYGYNLKDEIKRSEDEKFGKLLLAIMSTKRPEYETTSISDEYAKEIATNLGARGLQKYIDDIEMFKKTFISKTREDLLLIARYYYVIYKRSLYEDIKKNLDNPYRKLLKYIFFSNISPSEFFSKVIFRALQGLGTDIRSLLRALLFEENDMDNLREYYLQFRNINLFDDVKDDCSANYGKIISNLCLK